MKFDYKSYSNHLETENERLNSIIDELEKINEDQLTDIFMLNYKIKKAIEYIKESCVYDEDDGFEEKIYSLYVPTLLEILGDKENEET